MDLAAAGRVLLDRGTHRQPGVHEICDDFLLAVAGGACVSGVSENGAFGQPGPR